MAGMTTLGALMGTRFAGPVFGADLKHHDLFKVERTEGPPVYGEYFLIPVPGSETEFNIEIDSFGYVDRFNIGNHHPDARKRFTAEECTAVQKVIRLFFSDPNIFKEKFLPPARCLGDVSFRPDWIAQERLRRSWMFWANYNSDDPIYLGDFLGDDVVRGVATNKENQVIRIDDVATQLRGLPLDNHVLANIGKILDTFSFDPKGKKDIVSYRGTVGPLSAREAALRSANQYDQDIIDKTEVGKLLVNEAVLDAICDLAVKFFQLQGLGYAAALEAAHKKIGPEPEPKLPEKWRR
jgi:hypothetical protein